MRRGQSASDTLDRKGVLKLLQAAREIDKEFVEIGDRLVPEAGAHLRESDLINLILDDLPYPIARQEVQKQKAFVGRLTDLLPTLLRYFKFQSVDHVVGALLFIDDCFYRFPQIKSAPRRDRALREAIQATERAEKIVGEAITALAALPSAVSVDFQKFFDAYVEAKNKKNSRVIDKGQGTRSSSRIPNQNNAR